ncbi:MAG: amino acid adenylation domain-containing protein [Candidatus Aminicenantes bacterium]|nr:MAG: amino acid adenylation domain-containing protein [Candidatus Aminicenantes bacterium]
MANSDYFNELIKSNEEDYWLNNLAGELVKTSFPYTNDNPPGNVNQHQREILKFQLAGKLYLQLMKLSNNSDIRLHFILTAALVSLLNKYTGNQDIIVGTSIYKQEIDAEFINTVLILRNRLNNNMTFKELLLQVRAGITEVVENQNYPLERLLQKLEIPFSKNDHFPLFDVAIIVENIHDKRYLRNINPNMLFSFSGQEGYVEGIVEYNASLYEIKAIERVIIHLKNLLNEVLVNVNLPIDRINILTPEDKRHLLYEVNNTKIKYPADKTLHELFEEQVEKTPGNIAVRESYSSGSITYGELNRKSNQLAGLLRSRGISTEEIAAIMAGGSVELVIGIMGILKAGAGYLPIDPETPVNRTRFMLEESGASILLTSKNFIPGISGDRASGGHYSSRDIIFLDDEDIYVGSADNPKSTGKPMNIAYVMFTSGTSGRPKGVMVHHRGVVNYINWAIKTYVKDEKLDFPLYTSISFDLTVTSIFIPLLTGSSIVVYSGEYKELLIGNIIDDDSVGVVKITPSHLKLLREREVAHPGAGPGGSYKRSIKRFIVGGEELNSGLTKTIHESFNGQIEMYNEYGPTETVVGSMIYKFNPATDQGKSVPIGTPVYNTQVYILDSNRMPAPLTVTGEIYISGHGVARGYLNRPELTAEKFVKNPFVPGERMYRTGDMGRWVEAGKMEFSGRIDAQLKIRGYRFEPGEIERLLLKKDEIKEAIAVVKDDDNGDKYLCVYIVSNEKPEVNKLKEYLSKYLPAYMIPTYIMQIENIPLTHNGKVDRKAMPAPQPITESKYASPRDEVERMLTGIWENVLRIDNIGINDNFFTIGGDSIKTIQIVSRVKKAGYKIEMRDLFQEPTIARLAPLLKRTEIIPDQSVISGFVPLTPIQHWFFKSQFPDNHHFNQAVMFYSQEGIEEEAVKAVFLKLQEHHDVLRMTYNTNTQDGEMIQENQGLDYPFSLQVFDYRHSEDAITALESTANRIQAGIDLKTGPLMKLGLFHLEDGDRLLIVVHHLVIDGVSWRILFEDMETLFQQFKKKQPLALPLKSDSFKSWSEKLHHYANSPKFLEEKAYWKELESMVIPPLEKDFPAKGNHKKDEVSLSFNLSEKESRLLLTKVNHAFGTEVNDILLTALGLSVNKTFGNNRLLVALEGHGREEILDQVDISRTIGWFTSIYPIVLDIASGDDLARQIKETKESLRRAPNKGIGYGILKYLTKREYRKNIEFKLNPQINFNYLGQFDADIRQTSFTIAKEAYGNTMSPEGERISEIEISGIITAGRLVVTVIYNKRHYKPETMQTFLDNYKKGLCDTISYCVSRKERQLTPSDLTYPGMSIQKVEQLAQQYPIEDIYILSPMQEGKLFYTFYNQLSPGGSVQIRISISGNLDLSLFERSINELFMRYDILRTTFVYEGVRVPIQIILKERQVEFLYQDLREKITNENKQSVIDEFAERDRMRSFDFKKDVLMRTAVLQTGDRDYEVTWSFHHILMDGWCVGILFEEFLVIYNHLGQNKPYKLPPRTPYREYIRWLMQQDKKEAEAYWKKYLEGYAKETSLPKQKGVKRDQKGYQFERESFHFSEDKTSGLHLLAARSQVTVNTIIQAIWGILLSQYNREEDVVFGAVVSGRPSEITGVESMVGLFINTIPVRVSLKRGMTFQQLIHQVQEKAIRSEPYHYYPLARIQAGSILERNLLDHILVFENYPLAEQVEGIVERTPNKAFDVLKVTEYTQPDYNFHVVISPGDSLGIEFRFNSLVYDRNFVKKIALHIEELVDTILNDGDIRLEDIGISDEKAKLKFSDQDNYTADFGF